MKVLRELFVLPIRFYRHFISPLTPAVCRFQPSCSAYMLEAVRERGIIVGTALGLWRLLRCHPWSQGGFDPVPKKRGVGRG